MKRWIKAVLACSVIFILSSCYCTEVIYVARNGAHPRWLGNIKFRPVHALCFGEGKNYQAHLFTGYPSDIRSNLEDHYVTNSSSNFDHSYKGLYGARVERYISPGFVPYHVLGVGLEYSFSKNELSFNTQETTTNYSNELTYLANRFVLSANLITLITRKGLIGYVTIQSGLVNYSRVYSGTNIGFNPTDAYAGNLFDYRVGYGFQRFFKSGIGVHLEGGYGGGAYGRIGLSMWF